MWSLLLALSLSPALAGPCDDTDVDPWDTGLDNADCDDDGWTRSQGDCNDFNDEVNPGKPELCSDREDNDCNGYFNDGCDDAAQRGTLIGGSTCTTGPRLAPLLALPLLFAPLIRRRRR